jgi:secreted trypsin-like serine protease
VLSGIASLHLQQLVPKAAGFEQKNVPSQHHETIVGGSEIEPGSRPYLVAIGRGESALWGQYCGGSLISSGAVLLAAHCLFGGSINKPVWYPPEWVEFNRHDLFDDNGVVRVYLKDTQQCNGNAIYHPEYDHETGNNDVAILFLPRPITNYTPVLLNADPSIPVDNAPLDVAGWGLTENGYSFSPHAVTVNYITNEG